MPAHAIESTFKVRSKRGVLYFDSMLCTKRDVCIYRWIPFKTPYLQNHYFSGETKN